MMRENKAAEEERECLNPDAGSPADPAAAKKRCIARDASRWKNPSGAANARSRPAVNQGDSIIAESAGPFPVSRWQPWAWSRDLIPRRDWRTAAGGQAARSKGEGSMRMPEVIEAEMLAPCGMNCVVCYRHVGIRKYAKPCQGCLGGDQGKPGHCRTCRIKDCAQSKGLLRCLECGDFPCVWVKNLDKSYRKRYRVSLVENSRTAHVVGVPAFLAADRLRWICGCGGAFSMHDGVCSECGQAHRPEGGEQG